MTGGIDVVRFTDDSKLLETIVADQDLGPQLQRTEVLKQHSTIRTQLLSNAVRVNVKLLPNLAQSFERLGAQLGPDTILEPFVFSNPDVNAFVSETDRRTLIGVSSGAVNLLSGPELDFVIGHEIGHAKLGHTDVAANVVVEMGGITENQAKQLRAWQRAAEISADRAGLMLCGSLEVAANALFKTVSGINIPGLNVDPDDFAAQWDHLVQEVLDQGDREQWNQAHPFPPLRMKALIMYWRNRDAPDIDTRVSKLLALMSPDGGGEAGDPLLARFLFFGGLYVAMATGTLSDEARSRLQQMTPPGIDLESIFRAAAPQEEAIRRFRDALKNRRAKLTSSELHNILKHLCPFAIGAEGPREPCVERMHEIGKELGIREDAVDLFISKSATER